MTSSKLLLTGGRRLHQSTFSLGDETKTVYTTTHTESFTGRREDGQPLIFLLRDPCYLSQHYYSLDLNKVLRSSYTSTHSRDVHSPKDIVPHNVLRSLRIANWARNREGTAMKEVTNPHEATPYKSTYWTEHCTSASSSRSDAASGQPTRWHRHNILTGEERGPASPGNPNKQHRDRLQWVARRREMDCTAFRLY